ncbi:MAG: hypothetical protein ACLP1D_09385 [Xanthobacteraceae bacterium]
MTRLNSRRSVLTLGLGAVTVVMAGCASPGGALSVPEGAAHAPWALWNDPGVRGTPLALVSAAILAANPHNTQPWIFRVTDTSIEIFADLSRHLGAMDPFVREMHLGIGCAIENAMLAAAPNGYDASLQLEPGTLAGLSRRSCETRVATIRLARREGLPVDPLYQTIPLRHTNRAAYRREAPVPPEWLTAAGNLAGDGGARVLFIDNDADRRAFDAAVVDATRAIIADDTMIADSDVWFRDSDRQIELHRDGPSLETAGLSPVRLALARMLPLSPASAHDGWLSQTEMQLATAPLVGLIAVRDRYDRPTALSSGRLWQRLHLGAVAHGVAVQPLNQPIEMIDRERERGRGTAWAERIAAFTGRDWMATFAFRAGRPGAVAPAAARRALSAVIEA